MIPQSVASGSVAPATSAAAAPEDMVGSAGPATSDPEPMAIVARSTDYCMWGGVGSVRVVWMRHQCRAASPGSLCFYSHVCLVFYYLRNFIMAEKNMDHPLGEIKP